MDSAPRPVLLFDLDGIVTDLVSKWLAVYNRDYSDNLRPEDITSWDWDRFVKPECGKRIYYYLSRPGFFADLKPIPGAIEALERLSHRLELVVVTASPASGMRDKADWVKRHLPFVPKHNLVVTYRKDLVLGDFMFDDAPRNLEHTPATRIMMDYPYNRDFDDAYRVRNWTEFEALMDDLLARRAHGLALEHTGRRPVHVQTTL